MIEIITRWEDTQMPRDVDRQIWRQLKGAFQVNKLTFVETEDEMGEAIRAAVGKRVFLEPRGHRPVSEIPQDDIILILGNSAMNNMAFASKNETYRIDVVSQPTHLYGCCAAAIALEKYYGAN
jgi:DNA phosphorothioation-dependent restriction protein DptG